MLSPIKTLYTYFPLTFFFRVLFLLAINVAAAVIVYKLYKKNKINKIKAFAVVGLVLSTTFVVFLAVLGRRSLDYYRFGPEIVPYYSALFSGGMVDIKELLLNIVVFVPIGFLAYAVFYKHKLIWATLFGLIVSAFIELSQLVLKCGYVCFVDVIHNTLGALLGGLLGILVVLIIKIIGDKSKAKVKKDDSV